MQPVLRIIAGVLLSVFPVQSALAAGSRLGLRAFEGDQGPTGNPSEFVYRNNPDETLMPVYLIGAVAKPGLYHLPIKTDLTTLLSIAGGTTAVAEVSDIGIKRQQRQAVEKVDFENVVSSRHLASPLLESQDVVFVPAQKPLISQNAMLAVSFISGIVGIVVSSYAIYRLSR